METTKSYNHRLASLGNGALLIWWGSVLLIEPLTIGMGAMGTGLILLGINAVRLVKGFPTKRSTSRLGIIALAWGALVTLFSADMPTAFALLLITTGLVKIGAMVSQPKTRLADAG